MADREIIEMRGEPGDEGEILYSSAPRPPAKGPFGGFVAKVVGTALGVAVFLALIFFFVYVIVPLVAVLLLWGILSRFFRARR